MPKGKKNDHEWDLIAQVWEPSYREIYHCELCGKFHDVVTDSYLKQSEIPTNAKFPDSDIPYWVDGKRNPNY